MQMLYSSPVVYGAPAMPQAPQGYPGYGQGLYPNGMPMQPQPAPQIQQPQQVQQTQPPPLKGWQVSSQEEARKAMIDPDGSLFVFPDVSTGAIYTKQINPVDFSAVFRIYHPEPVQTADAVGGVDLSGYVPREEFEALSETVQSLRNAMEAPAACRYAVCVSTSPTGGSFRLLGNPCCAPDNALNSINGTAPAPAGGETA